MSLLSQNVNRKNDKPVVYEIKLQGSLDRDWSNWFEGMTISHKDDNTTITGEIVDQAALRGILNKAWNLNQKLISVKRVEV